MVMIRTKEASAGHAGGAPSMSKTTGGPLSAPPSPPPVKQDSLSTLPRHQWQLSKSSRSCNRLVEGDDGPPELDLRQLGFFLTTHDAWIHIMQQVQEKKISYALQSQLVKVVCSFDRLNSHNHPGSVSIPRNSNFNTTFQEKDPGAV